MGRKMQKHHWKMLPGHGSVDSRKNRGKNANKEAKKTLSSRIQNLEHRGKKQNMQIAIYVSFLIACLIAFSAA